MSLPPSPDPSTLQHALAQIKAGHFTQVLPVLEPYAAGRNDQAKILYAFCLAGTGRHAQAATLLCEVATRNPTSLHPVQDLSEVMAALDRRVEATATCRAALERTPHDARIHETLGSLLVQQGQLDDAVEILGQASALRPNSTLARNLLAMALTERGNMDDALAHLHETARDHPRHAGTLSNIGTILTGMGQLEDALDHFRRAITLRPEDAQIRLNHSVALLKAGLYAHGWQEHEWRFNLPGHTTLPPARLMPTLGANTDIRGRRVLITQEEGLGDTLMYLRYIKPLSDRGAITHLWVPQTLADLCRRVVGVHTVQVGGAVPDYDWHCPFISLPRVFAATPDAWGTPPPYLRADSLKIRELARFLPDNGRLNVGLVWGGDPRPTMIAPNVVDRRRSLNLRELAPLSHVAGINLISLQKGHYAQQMMDPPEDMVLYDPTDELHTMDDTAALIMSLDVVVSVDTSVVHLAGALGKPVLMMDRYDNCWRWLQGRTDTPWYPTLHIIRQSTPRRWTDVIERVAHTLGVMAEKRSPKAGGPSQP
ncbi:tetratricopeptide repeat protein [Acetobacter garciniae]|uniref:tetratricopeptide repeat protein n=1 Tax=Acetobacter garciniae TaxID=2817435 RepID=UPI002ED91CEE